MMLSTKEEAGSTLHKGVWRTLFSMLHFVLASTARLEETSRTDSSSKRNEDKIRRPHGHQNWRRGGDHSRRGVGVEKNQRNSVWLFTHRCSMLASMVKSVEARACEGPMDGRRR